MTVASVLGAVDSHPRGLVWASHQAFFPHSAGAGRTGTFIALSNILERVKAEGLLDVFQAVKSLRLQRPHMVQTLEQYEFCYKVVQDFIDIFSDYANFK